MSNDTTRFAQKWNELQYLLWIYDFDFISIQTNEQMNEWLY